MSYSNDYIFKIIEILGSLTKVTPLTGNKGEMLYRSKKTFDDKLYSKEEIKGRKRNKLWTCGHNRIWWNFEGTEWFKKLSSILWFNVFNSRSSKIYRGRRPSTLYVDPRYPDGPYSKSFDPEDQYAYDKSPL